MSELTAVRVKRAEIFDCSSAVVSEISSNEAVRSSVRNANVLYSEKSDLIS